MPPKHTLQVLRLKATSCLLFCGAALVLAALVGCSDTSTPSPLPPTISRTTIPPAGVTATPVPKATTPTQPALPRTPSTPPPLTAPSSTPEILPPPAPAAQDIHLEVSEPPDEGIFRSSSVSVKGTADLDAVVSVNGNIVALADDGSFNIVVALLEGPNPIEIMATNSGGKASSQILTIIYIP